MPATVNLKITPETYKVVEEALELLQTTNQAYSDAILEQADGRDLNGEEMEQWRERNARIIQIDIARRDLGLG